VHNFPLYKLVSRRSYKTQGHCKVREKKIWFLLQLTGELSEFGEDVLEVL
jgi:hypothetical protein